MSTIWDEEWSSNRWSDVYTEGFELTNTDGDIYVSSPINSPLRTVQYSGSATCRTNAIWAWPSSALTSGRPNWIGDRSALFIGTNSGTCNSAEQFFNSVRSYIGTVDWDTYNMYFSYWIYWIEAPALAKSYIITEIETTTGTRCMQTWAKNDGGALQIWIGSDTANPNNPPVQYTTLAVGQWHYVYAHIDTHYSNCWYKVDNNAPVPTGRYSGRDGRDVCFGLYLNFDAGDGGVFVIDGFRYGFEW